jgi:antitoxin (DNA-binding transcriptional repressor) of toxin-antitoxin stability system
MCYMSLKRPAEESVGVRELRQNLSVYLARLASGTVFRVTDRGRAVALLIPLPEPATTVERLVSAGRAVAPTRDLASLGRPTARTRWSVSRALGEIRDDRR